jgi:4-carboxymuconolactone decarboxylase
MKMANSSAVVIENGDVSLENVCLKGIVKYGRKGKMLAREKYFLTIMAITIMATVAWGGVNPFVSWAAEGSAAQAIGDTPKDVYPESGFRLPLVKKEDLDDYGKTVYDKVFGAAGRSVAGARGPFGMLMNSPKVLDLQYQLTNYIRYDSGMSGYIRELAILTTAREMDNQFEWVAHEPVGLKDGLPQSIIDIVKYRRGVEGLSETEAVIIQLGREMFGKKKVDSETFARALKIFGKKQLVELVTLMGIYAEFSALLNTFDMQLSPEQKQFVMPIP